MILPDNADVKSFEDAAPGSLVVGRFRDDGPNFIAVRADVQISTGAPSPHLAILNPWVDDEKLPYLCQPVHGSPKVLELGNDWAFDVSVAEAAPAFQQIPDGILVRSGPGFFIRLKRSDGYLDVSKGAVVESPPNVDDVAIWYAFTIRLPQPNVSGPGVEIMHWPHNGDSPIPG